MKNIFIGGVAKSGKSTFAKIFLDKARYNHIPLDYFASAFKHKLSDVGITSNVVIDMNSSQKYADYLSRVIEIIDCHDELFILDSAHIMPKDIVKYLDRDKWDIYYLGYSNISSKDKFDLIRKYDSSSDWTYKRSDDDLINTLDKLIDLSKEIEKECLEYDIKYIDTSYSFNFDNYK